MNPVVARRIIYLPIQRALGGNLNAAIQFHASLEHRSADAIERYQKAALRRLLEQAFANVPFYREVARSNGNVRNKDPFEVLAHLPIVTKAIMRKNPSSFRDNRLWPSWRSTSGSTGKPLAICKDRLSLLHMDAAMHAVYSWYGIEIADRQGRIWGRSPNPRERTVQLVKDLLLNRRRFSAFEITPEKSRLYLESLKRFRPAFLYCYPNAAFLFAQQLHAMGLSGKSLGLKAIICTAEPLLERHRLFMQSFFNCPIVSEYGTTENGILAMECERGGMHVLVGNVILEFLKDGRPAAAGEPGEIVVTELHSRSFPFIRYRTGDIGIPSPLKKCPCGRTFPLITLACGRDDSFIILPDGRKVHAAILVYVLKEGVLQFRGVQETPSELVIEIVPDNTFNKELLQVFQHKLQQYLGDEIQINFRKMEHIPPEHTGKVLYFVSRLKTSTVA